MRKACPKGVVLPLVLLAAGLALVAAMAHLEVLDRSCQSWADAVLVLDDNGEAAPVEEADDGSPPQAFRAWVRAAPVENFPKTKAFLDQLRPSPEGEEFIARARLGDRERVVLLDVPRATLEPLLVSGVMPEPGSQQVLAGDLATLDAVVMDDVTFKVVGRLGRGIGDLTFAYVLPAAEAPAGPFSAASGATPARLYPNGVPHAEAGPGETNADDSEATPPESRARNTLDCGPWAGFVRTTPAVAWGTTLGLLLVAVGGAMGQIRLLSWLGRTGRVRSFSPALSEIAARPWLGLTVHVVLYGLLFAGFGLGIGWPVFNAHLMQFVSGEFADGSLSYIGSAYASGNILRAAAATFFHNYVYATVCLGILPSLIVPFAGVVKNAVSFLLLGFVAAPIWTGSAAPLTYHAVTLTLELEAYVVAAFLVSVLPVRIFNGLVHGRFVAEAAQGLRVIGSGTLLLGLMLAIAALYEAVTLILLA